MIKKWKKKGKRGFLNTPGHGGMAAFSWSVEGTYITLSIADCNRAVDLDFEIKTEYKNVVRSVNGKKKKVFISIIKDKRSALAKIEKLQDALAEMHQAIVDLPKEGIE